MKHEVLLTVETVTSSTSSILSSELSLLLNLQAESRAGLRPAHTTCHMQDHMSMSTSDQQIRPSVCTYSPLYNITL